jgi:hypothetical protein
MGEQHWSRDAGSRDSLNERHLMRLRHKYICYHHEDRTHIGLNKETPGARLVSLDPVASARCRPNRESRTSSPGIPGLQ